MMVHHRLCGQLWGKAKEVPDGREPAFYNSSSSLTVCLYWEVFCECDFQPKAMDCCRKTSFFLKQIWVSVEGDVHGPTLTARN